MIFKNFNGVSDSTMTVKLMCVLSSQ